MEEQLIAVLTRIADALERLEQDGIIVLADSDNIEHVLKEVTPDKSH